MSPFLDRAPRTLTQAFADRQAERSRARGEPEIVQHILRLLGDQGFVAMPMDEIISPDRR